MGIETAVTIIKKDRKNGKKNYSRFQRFNYILGNTAQRTANAGAGAIRYNTEINVLELYNGNAWLPVGVLNAKTVTTTYTATQENSYLLIQMEVVLLLLR